MTTLTHDITTLLTAALANPQCDTTRGALADAMQERDCWNRETILPWVIAHRDNDAPRLLFAQWCDGNGEAERGEFIRVQCELAKTRLPDEPLPPKKPASAYSRNFHGWLKYRDAMRAWKAQINKIRGRYDEIRCRERELFLANVQCWRFTEERPGYCHRWAVFIGHAPEDAATPHTVYNRGFVSHITCTAADWLTHADAITREQPIERVRLTTEPEVEMRLGHDDGYSVSLKGIPGVHTGPRGDERAAVIVALSSRWPGIAFELPPLPEIHEIGTPHEMDYRRLFDENLNHIAASFGIPAHLFRPPT